MATDLDTLATALYVTTDDLLRAHPGRVPARPKDSFEPRISDAEMLTLAVMQAVLATPARPDGCAMPTSTCIPGSRTCRCSRVTTIVCVSSRPR